MILRSILLCSALLVAVTICAQTNPYDAGTIPDSLKQGAHAVLRESKQELIINSPGKAILKSHRVTTILDEQGNEELTFQEMSTSLNKLEEAEIKIYDAKGNLIKRIKQKEMSMQAYGDGLVDDGKILYFEVNAPSYPVTVEFNASTTLKGMTDYPSFYVDQEEKAIQQASLIVTIPTSLPIRYSNHLLQLKPQVQSLADNKQYTWQVSNLKAIPKEKGAGRYKDKTPQVMLAPTKFEIEGHAGDMSTWTDFGRWFYDLNKESMILPPASQQFYQKMTAAASTNRDKIRIIYNYLQKNFRYVSIQLGIGGLRSFPATFTEQKKYGDCKALSTYTKACLDAIGIQSFTTLINAYYNAEPVDPTFPHDGFNHVILCVPQATDTIWLECTSKNNEFGVLGNFTENRNGLLITEKGGILVHTPVSKAAANKEQVVSTVNLQEDGSGKASVTITTTGECKLEQESAFRDASKDDQKRYLVSYKSFIQPDDFEITLKDIDQPQMQTNIQLQFEKIPSFMAGTKMFIAPRLYTIWSLGLPPDLNRTQPYYFQYPFISTDTTTYQLPEGYTIDHLPPGKTLTFKYGSYTSKFWYNEIKKQVYTSSILELDQYRIPAKDFNELKKFFGEVVEDETQKIVLKK